MAERTEARMCVEVADFRVTKLYFSSSMSRCAGRSYRVPRFNAHRSGVLGVVF